MHPATVLTMVLTLIDALLSPVSYRSKVLELLHIDHMADLGEVNGQAVWAWSILSKGLSTAS